MAFLFRPAIPTEDMEGLSLPADPSPVKPLPQNSAQPAGPPEVQPADDAVLQDFLLRNFLTEEAAAETSPAQMPTQKIELPNVGDFDAALENLGDTSSSKPGVDIHVDEYRYAEFPASDLVSETPKIEPVEWALEETLANHKEWLDSHGEAGKKADLRKGGLEGSELIGVSLRHADLQDAILKSADLLLADLRDACLIRANLQETCLVGANLEGANLEGASLDSAMGLLPRQVAGSNLHEASLPAQILEFNALPTFTAGSKSIARLFATLMFVCFLSVVMIWQTKDIQLLADSAIISYLHSSAAAAAMPTDQIYLLAPALLVALFLFFLYRLHELWDAVLRS